MKKYVVILTESGDETVVGRYETLAEAKQHLENVTFYPPHCRFQSCLHISDDGWSGSGQDEDGPFTYHIHLQNVSNQ